MIRKNAWTLYDLETQKKCDKFAEEYKSFLSLCKTERECIDFFVNEAEKADYKELDTLIQKKTKLKAGDKVYAVQMGKSMVLFRIGKRPIEEGINILGAHIDSPRMDVKQNPLYENSDLAYLDTHYYGGIKKYLYVTMPLALHGVIVKKDGSTVVLNVGEDEDDPVFFVSDLLIHLSQEQMQKKASEVVLGEALDIIIGNKPVIIDAKRKAGKAGSVDEEDKAYKKLNTKKAILAILKEMYGIDEEDFESAELEVVPAGKARDAGFDRSMILGYGQDDRVCAYPSFRAIVDEKAIPERTSVTLLVDKEEIGSVGATGMHSKFFENALAEVMNLAGQYKNELGLRRALANSKMLSSDVSSGFDPTYARSFDKKNVSYLGRGLVFNKFTGSRGKSGSNDANAEYIAHLRGIFEKANVQTQTAELGRVDLGGGGTIAYILANYGMDVIDSGIAVLNMHAPWEATSKADIYEALKGYKAFLKHAGC
ncbi:MAG: aminopeptidase [Lachnospiraceae bacterium]|nr:aminopeptidase [Lachnospiraceae bacterium]